MIAQRDRERGEAAEGMTDQMHAAAGPADDGFQNLVRDRNIAGGAALGGRSISEQARGHATKLVVPAGDHRTPSGAGAAGPRDQYDGRTGPMLVVVDPSALLFDHLEIPFDQADLRQGRSIDTRRL